MAVRNIDAINNRGKQIMAQKKNLDDARMARVNRAMEIIRGYNNDIVDAIDTITYMNRHGLIEQTKTLNPTGGKKNTIYISHSGESVHLSFYGYGYKSGNSNQHNIDYYPNTQEFNCWSYLAWGGFDGWDPTTGKYHDDFFLPLVEEFASKVGPWCQAVFEMADRV